MPQVQAEDGAAHRGAALQAGCGAGNPGSDLRVPDRPDGTEASSPGSFPSSLHPRVGFTLGMSLWIKLPHGLVFLQGSCLGSSSGQELPLFSSALTYLYFNFNFKVFNTYQLGVHQHCAYFCLSCLISRYLAPTTLEFISIVRLHLFYFEFPGVQCLPGWSGSSEAFHEGCDCGEGREPGGSDPRGTGTARGVWIFPRNLPRY